MTFTPRRLLKDFLKGEHLSVRYSRCPADACMLRILRQPLKDGIGSAKARYAGQVLKVLLQLSTAWPKSRQERYLPYAFHYATLPDNSKKKKKEDKRDCE